MIAVLQRVSRASVSIEGLQVSSIGTGLLVLLGVETADGREDIDWLSSKIVNMRIFPDADMKMNKSALEVGGEFLVVSQFTLHASTKKGNRPSFIKAAPPQQAKQLYEEFVQAVAHYGSLVKTGEFGANMQVELLNDGPVTIVIDTKNRV